MVMFFFSAVETVAADGGKHVTWYQPRCPNSNRIRHTHTFKIGIIWSAEQEKHVSLKKKNKKMFHLASDRLMG